MNKVVFSVTLRKDVSNFGDFVQREESSPTYVFNMHIKGNILIKNDSKISQSVAGGQDNHSQHLELGAKALSHSLHNPMCHAPPPKYKVTPFLVYSLYRLILKQRFHSCLMNHNEH